MRFLWLYYIKGESEVKSYLVPVHVHSLLVSVHHPLPVHHLVPHHEVRVHVLLPLDVLVGLAVAHLIHLDLVLLPGQGAGGHLGPDLVRHVGISLPLDEGPWVVVVGHHHAVGWHAVAIVREANLRLQVLVVKLGSAHKHM